MKGFVCLNRNIVNHWIWLNPRHCQWWLSLIIYAEWEPRTVVFGKESYQLKRGQLATTIRQLMGRWECGAETVLDFLRVLESEGMIKRESTAKMTIISICNYDTHQGMADFAERKPKRKSEHLKEDKNKKSTNSIILSREEDLKFFEELSSSADFLKEAASAFKITLEEMKKLAEQFKTEMLLQEKFHSSAQDYRQHMLNWIKLLIRKGGGLKKFNLNDQTAQSKYDTRRASDVRLGEAGGDDSTF